MAPEQVHILIALTLRVAGGRGLPATMAYLSLDGRDPKDLADLIVQKLKA